jgi:hypothetical protein
MASLNINKARLCVRAPFGCSACYTAVVAQWLILFQSVLLTRKEIVKLPEKESRIPAQWNVFKSLHLRHSTCTSSFRFNVITDPISVECNCFSSGTICCQNCVVCILPGGCVPYRLPERTSSHRPVQVFWCLDTAIIQQIYVLFLSAVFVLHFP